MLNAADNAPGPDSNSPFAEFAPPIREQSDLRKAITAAYRRPETECLPPLVEAARVPADLKAAARDTARKLIEALRAKHKGTGVEGLVQEYSLSSQEGVALMTILMQKLNARNRLEVLIAAQKLEGGGEALPRH